MRPSWLVLTLVVFAFAISCFTLLAPWQFSRNAERENQNAALTSSFTANPAPLELILPAGASPGQDTQWRRVSLHGSYLPDGEVVARLRTVQGEAAFEILTPLRLDDGTVALVDRGFVRPVRGVQVPEYPAPPTGPVDLVARVHADETDPQGRSAFADETTNGRTHVYAVDSRTVASYTGTPVRPGYLALETGSPGVLGALPLPQLEAGPFFSYALQWIAFGAMAVLAWAYFTWREIKPGGALAEQPQRSRRRTVAEQIADEEAAENAALNA